ncbi:elongation factor P hydroxylase [Litorilituus lipolyticus]|uniref:Elongation factor P hydroxylase n=1 Tax=Litorilituus lipolyticus TaxID=2491017 RepID=A0A502L8J5_9GAMM|nr:elongation factor P hydroxylase [Litorilituus lipolyticus]TPH19209.1 elongation factor P hydroxylase [Litorilituus lipolyticus]
MQYNYQDLIQLFNNTFTKEYKTKLVKGGDEPIYIPANNDCSFHQVIFAHGYYASALHEIAHWCQAGEARRQLEDYGYWYVPDGRDEQQQKTFEQVEVYPQALEWAFNASAQKVFNISSDNLNGFQGDRHQFKEKVFQQVLYFLEHGFPKRAAQFITVLAEFYGTPLPLIKAQFEEKQTQIKELSSEPF